MMKEMKTFGYNASEERAKTAKKAIALIGSPHGERSSAIARGNCSSAGEVLYLF